MEKTDRVNHGTLNHGRKVSKPSLVGAERGEKVL